jgi:RimJ/RimL family protein N-acetyltransferase
MPAFPSEIRTERLLLRPWRGDDADALHPILVANYEHLAPWIPPRVATPAPVPALTERLTGFGLNSPLIVSGGSQYSRSTAALLGEVDLPFAVCNVAIMPRGLGPGDRAEIEPWLRVDETGNGFALEAARVARRRGHRPTVLACRDTM